MVESHKVPVAPMTTGPAGDMLGRRRVRKLTGQSGKILNALFFPHSVGVRACKYWKKQ